jgi:hypothetical protein
MSGFVTVRHEPEATNDGSDTDVHTLMIECLSGSPLRGTWTDTGDSEQVELSFTGGLEFEDFLKSVAALYRKRCAARAALVVDA